METTLRYTPHSVSRRVCLLLLCLILLMLAGSACSSKHSAVDSPTQASIGEPAQETNAGWIPFTHITSEASEPGAFKYKRYGAEYAADLPSGNISATSKGGGFNPIPDLATYTLNDMAYCIYRLRCYHEAETAALYFMWEGEAPASGVCWVGLPDWEQQCWRWTALPEDNRIEFDPAVSANEFHQCYAAVIITSGDSVSLDSVSLECSPDGMVEYTLFPPQMGWGTFLIDRDANIIKRWMSTYLPNSSAYLMDNGHLMRTCMYDSTGRGRLEEYDWDLNLVWYFTDFPEEYSAHHDIAILPNGNILLIVEEKIPQAEALALGKDPATLAGELVIDAIIELKPLPENAGEIVWVWRTVDHLIQDFASSKANYGVVADHPELLDLNFDATQGTDFTHANSVTYNAELDQIMLNFRSQSEFYIIDHSTTIEEAAGHTGGRYGRGGDFLYRWGNPQAYRQGTGEDRQLFFQHDSEWIPDGCPGAGHILVFNNGKVELNPENGSSSVVELELPLLPDGTYAYEGGAYGPDAVVWEYVADPPGSFYSMAMGGAQRLRNGNTLICSAMQGKLFEVTPDGEEVWAYNNPYPYATSTNAVFKAERYYLFGPDFPVE